MNTEIMNNKELQEMLNGLQPENVTPDEDEPIGRYGRMAMDYLHQSNPQRFSLLKMTGELTAKMRAVDEEARNKVEEITQKLLIQDPLPQTDDILVKTRHYNKQKDIAEEIVLNELVYVPR